MLKRRTIILHIKLEIDASTKEKKYIYLGYTMLETHARHITLGLAGSSVHDLRKPWVSQMVLLLQ